MAIDTPSQIPVDYLNEQLLTDHNIKLGILRLDLIHPEISGNKWFKLAENIRQAKEGDYKNLLTFGGAYSNHLAATAVAAKLSGFAAIGIIRGLHDNEIVSPTLDFCKKQGMKLHFVSKEEYTQKYNIDYLRQLSQLFNNPYIIPEGGNNEAGRKGCEIITGYLPKKITDVAIAIGTGTTFSGIRNSLSNNTRLLGFPVMKQGNYLSEEIKEDIIPAQDNWRLNDQYHFGGFAKHTPTLLTFMNDFYQSHIIKLDFVYTAKLLYGIYDLIKNGFFNEHSHIIAIHTGGLQGNTSLGKKLLYQ